jgi:uncharacterized protein YecE (DUF72 family)
MIVNRHAELSEWAENITKVQKRKIQIWAFANNYYSG